jgi:hypothetical protein
MTVSTEAARHGRAYRSVSTRRWAIGATVVTVGFCVLAAVPGGGQTAGLVLAPVFLLLTWRTWVVGIHVAADGVKVVGFLVSRRFRWDEVDHFAVLPLGGYPYSVTRCFTTAERLVPTGSAPRVAPSPRPRSFAVRSSSQLTS